MRRYKRKARKLYRRAKKYFKRRYGRGKHARAGRIRSKYVGFLLPDRLKVKLRYSATVSLVCDVNGRITGVLAGNSPYDPDASGSGNIQPTGWDQYSAFYRFWYCPGSTIRLQIQNPVNDTAQTNAVGSKIFGVFPATNQLSNLDLATMDPTEWPYVTEKYLNSWPALNVTRIKKYMATKKIYGYKTADNPNFIANTGNTGTGSNPTNQWWWNLYCYSPYGTTGDGDAIVVRLSITYYVHFFGRQEIPIS